MEVVNYAQKYNLQLVENVYDVDSEEIKFSSLYKYKYPCTNKNKEMYIILYRNKWFIRLYKPKTVDIIYKECR